MSNRRVFLADLTANAPTPLQRHGSGRGVVLQRVDVQGICVWRETVNVQQLRIEIDDGTGVALLQVRGEAVSAELQEVVPGKMVRAIGDVEDAPLFASGRSWKCWIDVMNVRVVDDPNAESLYLLETLLLHNNVYLKEAPTSTPTMERTSLQLLPFPVDSPSEEATQQPVVGTKRKLVIVDKPVSAPPLPLVSRPLQPSTLEMNATHRSVQPTSTTSIPPAEYQFHVSGADLKHIGSGAKILEMRLNNPPYSIIRANDRLKFNGKIVTTVTAVRKYAQLRTALEMETLASLLPPTGGAIAVSLNGAVRLLRQFISEAEEARHGVAVFEFAVPLSASTAPRTREEWSKLLYEFVGTKGTGGCSLRDLQFAFPSLSVDKIEAMLTDLQMDAVIYLIKGTYRLV